MSEIKKLIVGISLDYLDLNLSPVDQVAVLELDGEIYLKFCAERVHGLQSTRGEENAPHILLS